MHVEMCLQECSGIACAQATESHAITSHDSASSQAYVQIRHSHGHFLAPWKPRLPPSTSRHKCLNTTVQGIRLHTPMHRFNAAAELHHVGLGCAGTAHEMSDARRLRGTHSSPAQAFRRAWSQGQA